MIPHNPLREYFETNQGRSIQKWDHYFDIYHKHFARFVGRSPRVLEIGVAHGGSLAMWHHYFGQGAMILGMDIDSRCRQFAEANTTIIIGDQGNRQLMKTVAMENGPFDIVIDDGGHTMMQQIVSLEELLPATSAHGVYLVEDLHTSYWAEYGGGLGRGGSFIEYAKALVDNLNGWHLREGGGVTDFTQSTRSMTFYDSVLVIEKQPLEPPRTCSTGFQSF
jgi:hypothetical protein